MEHREKHVVETLNFNGTLLAFDRIGLCAILLSGSMDTHVVAQLREKTDAVIAGRRFNFVVDLDGVSYVSSTGLGFLMNLLRRKRDYVFLSNPRPAVLKPFNLFDVTNLFSYYRSVDDLVRQPGVPAEVVADIRSQKESVRALGPHKRGLEILADYLENEEELHEIQRMTPYIHAAEQQDRITLPAEEKYASVLYMFLERAFSRAGECAGEPIDDQTVELVAKELMTNAVKHGYHHRHGGMVRASYATDPAKIVITFTDHGTGYAPAAPDDDGLPAAGLQLLRRLFDELTIGEADAAAAEGLVLGKGTTVRLVKHLAAAT
ncbi:STAS domain-containing protein [bacterium]|nr:STAS domain-containing protein [bacterium]